MDDKLRALANKRRAAFWPAAEPFDDCDVVISFRSREDAEAFSACLAYGEPGTETLAASDFDWEAFRMLRQTSGGYGK